MPNFVFYIKNVSDADNQNPKIGCIYEEAVTAPSLQHVEQQIIKEMTRSVPHWRLHYQYWIRSR